MIKLNFYEEAGILYYGDSPEIGKVLPQEAQELSDRAAEFVKCRQYEAMEEGFRKVSRICRQQHTDPADPSLAEINGRTAWDRTDAGGICRDHRRRAIDGGL